MNNLNKAIARPVKQSTTKWVRKDELARQDRKEFDLAMAKRPLY